MAFKAENAVEALDWDFRPYVKAHGTTPEPTDDQVQKMNKALRLATIAVTGEDFDPENRAEMARVFGKLTDEQLSAMESANLDAIEIVTNGCPSREQINGLPFRHKRLYIKSLVKDLNDPEGSATATNP